MQHDTLVRKILETVKDYDEGKRFVPRHFVMTLKDWVFSHIAISDKMYADYFAEQIRKGLLSVRQLEDL
jgi:hemerythrin